MSVAETPPSRWASWLIVYQRWITRHALGVILAALAVTALSGYVIATRAGIDTRTSNLLSKHLRFHALNRRFERLFPQQHEAIVLVLRGTSSRRVDGSARRLLGWFARHPRTYRDPLDPDVDPFFQRSALLYLSVPELRHLAHRLVRAGPVLGRLADRPTLVGLDRLLLEIAGRPGFETLKARLLPPVLAALGKTVTARAAGRPARVAWSRILLPGRLGRARAEAQTVVTVRPRPRLGALRPYHAAVRRLREALPRLGVDRAHGVDVGWTGGAVLADEQLATIGRGLGLALGVSLLVILILVALAVRSVRTTLAILVTLLMGLSWTTALATVTLGRFNLISVAFAVLFVGLGVDFGIQYGVRYLEEYAAVKSVPTALTRTVRGLAWPLTLAALAAAISFYAFLPTSYTGIIDLGLVAGTSMFIAWYAYITLMPAWIALLGRPQRHPPLRHAFARRYAQVVEKRAGRITLAAALLTLAALPFSSRVSFDFNPLHLMDRRSPAVRTLDRLAAHSRYSPYSINLLVRGPRRARLLARRLRTASSVGRVVSVFSLLPPRQRIKRRILARLRLVVPPFVLRPRLARFRRVPPDTPARLTSFVRSVQALAARHRIRGRLRRNLERYARALGAYVRRRPGLASLSRLQTALLGGLVSDLGFLGRALRPPRVTLRRLPRSVVRLFYAPGGIYRLEIFSRLDLAHTAALERFVNQVRRLAPNAVGTPVMLVEGGKTVLDAFLEASLIALVLTAVLLYAVLRRPGEVTLILATTLASAVLTTATMSILGRPYDLANIIVLPLLLGLSLVYGIYVILRWRDGVAIEEILRSSTPRGILYSGATTLGTFGSLTLARDPGVSSLGWALVIALGWVLAVTLFLLPSLLIVVGKETRGTAASGV